MSTRTTRVGGSAVRGWKAYVLRSTLASSCNNGASSAKGLVETTTTMARTNSTWRSIVVGNATSVGTSTSCCRFSPSFYPPHKRTNCLVTKRSMSSSLPREGISATILEADDDSIESSSTSSSAFMWGNSQIIDVTSLAEKMRQDVRNYTQQSRNNSESKNNNDLPHRRLKLVGILAHAGPFQRDTELYSQRIAAACHDDGIQYELRRCKGDRPVDVFQYIQQANAQDDVDGILVFYPIFKREQLHHDLIAHHSGSNARASTTATKTKHGPYKNQVTGVYYKTYDDFLRDAVDAAKDVEGLSEDYNTRRPNSNNKGSSLWNIPDATDPVSSFLTSSSSTSSDLERPRDIFPCTALSVKLILDHFHIPSDASNNDEDNMRDSSSLWEGQTVTVINRSEIMGRPLAAMLASSGANVYSIDVDSILQFRQGGRLRRCTTPHITLEWCLNQSSVVVSAVPYADFQLPSHAISPGTTVVNVSAFPNVDEEALLKRPGIKYIPQVGKVTVAVLEQNLVRLHDRKANKLTH